MPYVAGALLLLVLLFVLARAFATASPAAIARGLRWGGAAVGAFTLLLLAITGRLAPLFALLPALVPLLLRVGPRLWRRFAPVHKPRSGHVSEVETATLRMTLDHDSGTMSGTVQRGRFAGRRLERMSTGELVELRRWCALEDEAGIPLLDAYLDRFHPDWRSGDGAAAAGEGGDQGGAAAASGAMTRDEAYRILGLAPGASEAEIRAAHRRLMVKLHPDQGGSTYLAARVNQARDLLLKG
jgi:hypothetical protein